MGFDGISEETTTQRFLWYWVLMGLFVTTMIFFGQFLSVALPDEAACTGKAIANIINIF